MTTSLSGAEVRTAPDTPRMATVWLHGAGLSGSTWADLVAGFADAVTPDLPGHGAAPRVSPATVEGFADALEPLLPDRFAAIGHSLGGMVALEIAARHPDRVRALVMVETVPTVRATVADRAAASAARLLMRMVGPTRLAGIAGWGETRATAAHLKAQLSTMTRQRLADALDAAFAYDGRPHLARIAAPALVVVGRQNPKTHKGAKAAAEAIPNARFAVLPGGHMLHTDVPDDLRETILSFLQGIEP